MATLASIHHVAPLAADSCFGATAIACENAKPGNPQSEWDLSSATGDPTIVGFTTDISVDHGQTIHFKIKTSATDYRLDIYRLGWYGGMGARKVATVLPSVPLPQSQPACLNDTSTGLVDCGNWAESAHWDVPADAVSGVYLAKLIRSDTGGASHIVFVVRDDSSQSDLLYQTSDETWEAYNQYGGNSLYTGSPAGRAYKVSYNRPFTTRDYANPSFLFGQEYPMIRWLERNGYDVSYSTDVDTARRASTLLQHKVFLSVGHDEYWSGEQRSNVEAARAAGVNLGFFSGNEVFWKTRWEPSIDRSSTAYRTLVCYKETKAGAKIDPNPVWTGTWRDKRFSPPSDGGRPENALTGTLFTVDAYRTDAMTVPSQYANLRFWRNTSVASLTPGQVATFPAGILGHEWDEDVDNGSRPAGLFDMSSTTLTVDKHLIDEGNTYVTGSATHHLTLYRASSGALVFGAGTAQWTWGLDPTHDYFLGTTPPVPTDARMQQATVNLFADMGAQPVTLQSGLIPATQSTDTAPPSSSILSPAAGGGINSGATVNITGSAGDTGGGVVAAVEVSLDGGNTWHRATGTTSWSYSWTAAGYGNVTIKSRAVDDSGNIETPGAGTTVSVICPCSLWSNSAVPSVASSNDGQAVELGIKFTASTSGYITGIRFYKGTNNTGTHVVSLWSATGGLLGRATATGETATGWQTVHLDTPVAITGGTTYVASYYAPQGRYAVDTLAFSQLGYSNPPLRALSNSESGGNGVYSYSATPTFPQSTFNSSNYWVDVVFDTTAPPDTTPPTVASVSPAAGATGSDPGGIVTATFTEALDSTTVSTSTFQLRQAGTLVPATVTYDANARKATLTPNAPLAYSTSYTATVIGGASGVKDLAGNAMTADQTWTFTTAAAKTCPCTIWPASTVPAVASVGGTQSVELGVKFRADNDGFITGIRFYKGSRNTGTHVGSLWTKTGSLLARGTFTNETSSGWQQLNFANPVPVTGGTTYVASYHAPVGGYAVNTSYFASASYANPPLRALQDGLDGGNGVYLYSGTASFPTDAYQSSNYWVDVVYTTSGPTDTTPPQVSSVTPAGGTSGAAITTDVTAVFNEAMSSSTIDTNRFQLRDSSGNLVAATVSYDSTSRTATLHPTASLAYGATYMAVIKGGSGGVTDLAGNPMAADYSWSFTTKTCPCSLWSSSTVPSIASSSDANPVELGVKFTSDVAGYVTGIRFYKGSRNTGTHVGSLWTSTGTLLARATFTNETATGWQQVIFGGAVAISANTTYVASYFAPSGGYSVDQSYFGTSGYANPPLRAPSSSSANGQGVYLYSSTPAFPTQSYSASNYWVDVVFQTAAPNDTTPPTVASVSPSAGSQASVGTTVSATFSEDMNPTTIDTTRFKLRAGTTEVLASVSYNASTRTATLTPQNTLAYGATYTATISGGSGGVTDVAGNALAANYSWSFSTRSCPCTLWPSTAVPQILSSSDTNPVELGVKFRSDVDGYITGIRFYKGANNTGTHVGSLWTLGGSLLARVTFGGETATGWQQVSFASPVPITANTTYVASYFAPNGGWSVDPGFFATSAFVSAPLRALATGTDGPNGVYLYGPAPAFPTDSYNASNYSVDVVFTLTP